MTFDGLKPLQSFEDEGICPRTSARLQLSAGTSIHDLRAVDFTVYEPSTGENAFDLFDHIVAPDTLPGKMFMALVAVFAAYGLDSSYYYNTSKKSGCRSGVSDRLPVLLCDLQTRWLRLPLPLIL